MYIDFYLLTTWMAPKHDVIFNETTGLAIPSSAKASNVSAENSDLNFLTDLYWAPWLDFVNSVDQVSRLETNTFSFLNAKDVAFLPENGGAGDLEPSAYELPEGWIWCSEDQRFLGSFSVPLEMKKFPFDSQSLRISIESASWNNDQLKFFFAEPSKISLSSLFSTGTPSILGWKTSSVSSKNEDIVYPYNHQSYNRLNLLINVSRISSFYTNKIVIGGTLLMGVLLLSFLLEPTDSNRFCLVIYVLSGLISYLFVIAQYTPILPYDTSLDMWLKLCFLTTMCVTFFHAYVAYCKMSYSHRELMRQKDDRSTHTNLQGKEHEEDFRDCNFVESDRDDSYDASRQSEDMKEQVAEYDHLSWLMKAVDIPFFGMVRFYKVLDISIMCACIIVFAVVSAVIFSGEVESEVN